SRAARFTPRAAERGAQSAAQSCRADGRGALDAPPKARHPSNSRPPPQRRAADAFAERLRPHVTRLIDDGCTLKEIAEQLTRAGLRTRHGRVWELTRVHKLLKRL